MHSYTDWTWLERVGIAFGKQKGSSSSQGSSSWTYNPSKCQPRSALLNGREWSGSFTNSTTASALLPLWGECGAVRCLACSPVMFSTDVAFLWKDTAVDRRLYRDATCTRAVWRCNNQTWKQEVETMATFITWAAPAVLPATTMKTKTLKRVKVRSTSLHLLLNSAVAHIASILLVHHSCCHQVWLGSSFWCPKIQPTSQHQGSHLREKTAFFTQKQSRLRKSENAVRLLYTKNSDLTHQNAFSLFVFCTQQRFVEHLLWV